MRCGDLVTGGPGDVPVEHGDVVGVDAQQLQRPCRRRRRCRPRSPPGGGHRGWLRPGRARPRRSARASARCSQPGHVVGVSKTPYGLTTPRCLDWAHELQQTSTDTDASCTIDCCRSPRCRRRRPHRRCRLSVADVIDLVDRTSHAGAVGLVGNAAVDRRSAGRAAGPGPGRAPLQRSPWRTGRGRRRRPRRRDGLRRRRSRPWPTSIRRSSMRSAGRRRTRVSSSPSRAAGVPRRTRSSCSAKRSRSTAREPKRPDGSPPPRRQRTSRETRSTSGTRPRPGCPGTVPSTGCARSTTTNPGTTSCVPGPIDHGCPARYADPTHDPRMQP